MPQRESDLYAPVKSYLESAGYQVRGEVGACDILGVHSDSVIAVELKLSFGLPVLYQALDRLPAVDLVYVAIAIPLGRKAAANWDRQLKHAVRLCRMLGVGLLSVRDTKVETHADPTPYQPRKQKSQRLRLLGEFHRRTGDHNVGGTTKRPRMTAYREDALACANALAKNGAMKGAQVRNTTGITNATTILRNNVYGWFEKIAVGTFNLAPTGHAALATYADVVSARG
jgi:hypothetical protein